jgi:hypothetical protein
LEGIEQDTRPSSTGRCMGSDRLTHAPGTIRACGLCLRRGRLITGGAGSPREPPTSDPMRPARFERAYCACVVRGGAQLMTWFPERIERVCRQPPERCRDLAWLHRGLSTVSDTASRRSWRQRLDRRPADKRPSGGSSPGNGHGVGARRTTRRRGRPHAPRAGPTLTSIGMLLAGFGLGPAASRSALAFSPVPANTRQASVATLVALPAAKAFLAQLRRNPQAVAAH